MAKALNERTKVIDFSTMRGYGHDYMVNRIDLDTNVIHGSLWSTPGPVVGDYLILPHHDKKGSTRYRFTEVRACWNPPDMYHYAAVFDPRTSNG